MATCQSHLEVLTLGKGEESLRSRSKAIRTETAVREGNQKKADDAQVLSIVKFCSHISVIV